MRSNAATRVLSNALAISSGGHCTVSPCFFLFQTKTIRRWYNDQPDARLGRSDIEDSSIGRHRHPSASFKPHRYRRQFEESSNFVRRSDASRRHQNQESNFRQESSREEHDEQDIETENVEFVPFEGIENTTSSTLSGLSSSSSLTENEKRAFQKLQDLAPKDPIPKAAATAQPASLRRAQRKTFQSSLDALLDEALSELDPQQASRQSRSSHQSEQVQPEKLPKTRIRRNERKDERARIRRRLGRCRTDFELWEVLETDILNPIAGSYTETSLSKFSKKSPQHKIRKVEEKYMRLMGSSVSLLLVEAAQVLREQFPTSLLSTSIIPRLRQAGPLAFALGASTKLFNQHLSQSAEKNEDIPAVVELLTEMDRDIIEPDEETVAILTRVLELSNQVRQGAYGEAVESLWQTDRMRNAVKDIQRWVHERGKNVGPSKALGEEEEEVEEDEEVAK